MRSQLARPISISNLGEGEEEVDVVAPGWLAGGQVELDDVIAARIVFLRERRHRPAIS